MTVLLSPIARWLAVGAVVVVLAGWGWIEHLQRQAAELRAAAAEAAVKGRDQAIAVLERTSAAAEARAASFNTIRRSIDAAAPSRVCADSPALRAALGGLRDRAATPGGARQPHDVPAGAGGAGGAR